MKNTTKIVQRNSWQARVGIIGLWLGTSGLGWAEPEYFSESFDGATLAPGWKAMGDQQGHLGLNGRGAYVITDALGGSPTSLERDPGSPPHGDFHSSITLSCEGMSHRPNRQTVFGWKFVGPDGVLDIKLNSFDSLQIIHVNSRERGANGVLKKIDKLGYVDGQTITISLSYDYASDKIKVGYALGDTGSERIAYEGPGHAGSIGNIYTTGVVADLNKFSGEHTSKQVTVMIEHWSLTSRLVVPEPTLLSVVPTMGW